MKKIIFKLLKIIGVLLILIIIGGGVFAYLNDIPLKSISNRITANFNLPECSEAQFTAAPIDLENLAGTTPLGNLSPPAHTFPTDHIYFNFIDGVQDIPVYAPGDVTITSITSSLQSWADPPFVDYTIRFSLCTGVQAYYIHVHELSDKLQQAFDENKGGCESYETGERAVTSCDAGVNIKVTAGEKIAQTARQGQHNFDLGVYDKNMDPHIFSNQGRWGENRSNYQYTQCPFDYYTDELKTILMATLGDFNDFGTGPRTVEPICGTIGQDVPGTAQGVWFLKDAPTDAHAGEDQHIALVYDNYDPTRGALSIGIALESLGIPSRIYYFIPENEGFYNRKFSEVAPSTDVYCYQGEGGSGENYYQVPILLQLVDEQTIRLGNYNNQECGTGPWTFDQFQEFVR